MTLTDYTMFHLRHLIPTLIASVLFNGVWLSLGGAQAILGASLSRQIADFTLYAPLLNLSLVLLAHCLHESDRGPYELRLALVDLGGRLGCLYRVVLMALVLGFVINL